MPQGLERHLLPVDVCSAVPAMNGTSDLFPVGIQAIWYHNIKISHRSSFGIISYVPLRVCVPGDATCRFFFVTGDGFVRDEGRI